jgi:Concanavalin A-like lectin/glucanases superfamily
MPTLITRGSAGATSYGTSMGSTSGFNLCTNYTINYLLVAGGGGGSQSAGGGGGAGGFLSGCTVVVPSTPYSVVVGAGGTAGLTSSTGSSGNGSNTSFFNIVAVGGGSGATGNTVFGGGLSPLNSGTFVGAGGGSGGGSGGNSGAGNQPVAGGSGTPGQGNGGGSANGATNSPAGGGGGASAAGGAAGSSAGNGGAGASSPLVPLALARFINSGIGQVSSGVAYFSGGGGGGAYASVTPGSGGLGGGGGGSTGASTAGSGLARTGGGGGGTGNNGGTAGLGGSGVAIISYNSPIQRGSGGTVFNNGTTLTGSVLFNGSTDYLSLTSPTSLTGTFTLEFWLYQTSPGDPTNGTGYFFNGTTSSDNNRIQIAYNPNGNVYIYEQTTTSNFAVNGNTALSLNTWNHIAFTSDGTTIKIYQNGTLTGSGTANLTPTTGTSFYVGLFRSSAALWYFPGYISNFRYSNNVVYTSNFTPPVGPLSKTSNTVLLICQDKTGTTVNDNSGNGIAITRNGSPTITPIQPSQFTIDSGTSNTWYHVFTSSGTYIA